LDLQAPTKMEQPNSFPALSLHCRASHPLPLCNLLFENIFTSSPSSLSCKMAGPVRSSTSDNRLIQPPRPPNAWILYRSDKLRELPPTAPGVPRRAQAEVSKLISNMWKGESDDVRTQYERRADAKKAEHQAMYPGYRFQPMKKEEKDRLREEKRLEKERERAQSKRGRARTTPYSPGFVAPPMPYPLQYYPQEMHYGPAGPSPPISAASSPRDTGPYQESMHGIEDHSDPHRTDASPSIYPPPLSTTNLPSSSPSVSPTSPFSRTVPPPPQAPWPIPATSPMTPHRTHPGPSQWQQPYMPSSPVAAHSPRWMDYNNQSSPQAQVCISFIALFCKGLCLTTMLGEFCYIQCTDTNTTQHGCLDTRRCCSGIVVRRINTSVDVGDG
jgi:hypothetical protein